jgi:hypothetical protein
LSPSLGGTYSGGPTRNILIRHYHKRVHSIIIYWHSQDVGMSMNSVDELSCYQSTNKIQDSVLKWKSHKSVRIEYKRPTFWCNTLHQWSLPPSCPFHAMLFQECLPAQNRN